MKLRLLVNPTAGSGAASRKLPEIVRGLRRAGLKYDLVQTRGPGDATQLVREAADDGIECVAVVGGDGTLNEAAQGYLDSDGNPSSGPDLALIPAGTGGDFRKTFDLPDEIEAAIRRLAEAPPRPVDIGIAELHAEDGSLLRRAFLNILSFGLGGLTDQLVNRSPKWMGGRAAFFLGTLRALAVYRNPPVSLSVDGNVLFESPIVNVAIANGRYFGGGMLIAPEANPSDGQFDVVSLLDMSRMETIALTNRVYAGTHLNAPKVRTARGALIEAKPLRDTDRVLIDLDGETPGQLPLIARIERHALRMRL